MKSVKEVYQKEIRRGKQLRFSVRFKNDMISHCGIVEFKENFDISNPEKLEKAKPFLKNQIAKNLKKWGKKGSDIETVEYYYFDEKGNEVVFFKYER